jgi:molybdenum-dependent DNA-binding transcriptional regulator ModE
MGIIAYDRGQVLGKHGIKYCWLDGERTSISGAARTLGFSQSAVWNWTQGKYPKKVPSNLVFEEPKNV